MHGQRKKFSAFFKNDDNNENNHENDNDTENETDDNEVVRTPSRSDVTKNMEERLDKCEAAMCNMATWQPVASDIISGNRDLIMALNSRIEYLETAVNQLAKNLATGNLVGGNDR